MDKARILELLGLLKEQLANQGYQSIKQMLEDVNPVDIAELFEELTPDEIAIIFRLLPKHQAAEVFSYLNTQQRKDVVSAIQDGLLNHIFYKMFFDDKIDFLEEMPSNFVKNLLAQTPEQERALINQFLRYPDNSAGSLMTIEFVDLKKDMTVQDALGYIRRTGKDRETIYTCYVLDDTRRLEGIISLRKLVLADQSQLVGELMETDLTVVEATDDQEYVAELFKRYDMMALPVVDKEYRLIGIITIDDIVDVLEQEATEDFQKMAAMGPSDEAYLDSGVFHLARKRIVWLLVLMVSATFTGGIITHYETLLSNAVILTAFIPMLMDSGGNAGSQSSTLIIRGIALGEIHLTDWAKVLWKELRVSIVTGLILAVVNLLRMLLMGQGGFPVALTVSLTMALTIIIAKLVGCLLPIAAKALKMDPAIMAGPLITTIVDALALILYFTIASFILHI